jgi:hypothetical protein
METYGRSSVKFDILDPNVICIPINVLSTFLKKRNVLSKIGHRF